MATYRRMLQDEDGNNIIPAGILDVIYPIGSIYMSATLTTATAVGNALGGTWEAWGAGRVPVGMGSNGTTNYTTVEATGGEDRHTLTTSEMPSHTHNVGYLSSAANYVPQGSTNLRSFRVSSNVYTPYVNGGMTDIAPTGYTSVHFNQNTGGGGSHENRQPYITCYMYKRTA